MATLVSGCKGFLTSSDKETPAEPTETTMHRKKGELREEPALKAQGLC